MSQLGRADSLSSVVTPGSFTGILRSQNCASPWLRGRLRSTPPEMDRSNQWLSRERESKTERSSESHIFHPQAADAAVRNMLACNLRLRLLASSSRGWARAGCPSGGFGAGLRGGGRCQGDLALEIRSLADLLSRPSQQLALVM